MGRVDVGTVATLAVIALILISYYVILPAVLRTSTPLGYIVSSSMHPTYEPGDLVMIAGVDPSEIRVGDVIVFWRDGQLIMHRVIRIERVGQHIYFFTRGDNPSNPACDYWVVRDDQVVGKVVGRVPYLGYLFWALSLASVRVMLIVALAALIAFSLVGERRKRGGVRKPRRPLNVRRLVLVTALLLAVIVSGILVLRAARMWRPSVSILSVREEGVRSSLSCFYIYALRVEIRSPGWPGLYVSEVVIELLSNTSNAMTRWTTVWPVSGALIVGLTATSDERLPQKVKARVTFLVVDSLTGARETLQFECVVSIWRTRAA